MRGRKPKPTAFKVLHGSDQPRNPHEPRPTGDLVDCPAHFDDAERDIWREALASAPPGLLKRLDAAVMEVWTTNFAMHRLARAELAGEAGLGTPAAKRLLAVIRWTGQTVLRCASELGFSPTSRPRTSVGTTWRPGPATVRDDDGPQESIEEYLERGRALEASRGMPPSKRH